MESYVLDTLQCGPVTHSVEIKVLPYYPRMKSEPFFLTLCSV